MPGRLHPSPRRARATWRRPGLSYEFIVARLTELDPALAAKRLVIANLGNGASLAAVKDGRGVASTIGFTAVDGLMRGTRTSSLDPGVILYLMDSHGMGARVVEKMIYNESGLLGVSGISSDMRTLRQSSASEAREAIHLFVYRIVREIGSLAAALGGLDGLVFTGGIGENDVAPRAEILAMQMVGRGSRRAAEQSGRGPHQGRLRVGRDVSYSNRRGAHGRPP